MKIPMLRQSPPSFYLVLLVFLVTRESIQGFSTEPRTRCLPIKAYFSKLSLVPPVPLQASLDRYPLRGNHISNRNSNGPVSGTALNALVTSTVAAIGTFYKTSPYAAALFTGSLQASAADFVAQRTESRKEDDEMKVTIIEQKRSKRFDLQRNLAFILYGGFYQGLAQEFIYNKLFPIWFGTGKSPITVALKVIADMLVCSPLISLPLAYMSKAVVFGYPLREGLAKYVTDIREKGLLFKFWCLWAPVQLMTFSIIPEHLRISFITSISFFWLIALSIISSNQTAV